MANVKLLRQQVTDYQRQREVNRRKYEGQHASYSADTEAFNAMIQRQYDYSASANKKSDLDLVGATYYDREAGTNVAVGGTSNPIATGSYGDFTQPEGLTHNAFASFTPSGYQEVSAGVDGEGNALFQTVPTGYNAMYNGQVIGSAASLPAVPYYADPNSIGAYWDSYDKVWRNAPTGGKAPTERSTKAPNLTSKEVGILEGKVNPMSYADMSKEDASANSAFADPEDPYNLKDAGVLTRAIAGKI